MKTTFAATLPRKIVEGVHALNLSRANKNHAFRFLERVKTRSFRDTGLNDSEVPFPKNYLREMFNSKYHEWLTPLRDAGLVLANDSYSTTHNYCKTYRLNSDFMNDQYSLIEISAPARQSDETFRGMRKWVIDDLSSLRINRGLLIDMALDRINAISMNDLLIDDAIPAATHIKVRYRGANAFTTYTTTDRAIKSAQKNGRSLIMFKGKYYVDQPDSLLHCRKAALFDAYVKAVERLADRKFFASRNDTNNRLDSSITNLCAPIMEQLMRDNDLAQIDLCNSQWAFLANWWATRTELMSIDDFKMFHAVATTGVMYEWMQDSLALPSRSAAKKMCFEVLFSSHRNNTADKGRFRSLFPTLVSAIDEFKKVNGSNTFAVELQRHEAKMFIDDIWSALKQQGLFCLTKHDSLIVRKADLRTVQNFLSGYLDNRQFKVITATS